MAEMRQTSEWIVFFEGAGLEQPFATQYAMKFAENDIQSSMLIDLTKEYLTDMGISLAGHKIAVLKHARKVHEEVSRSKVDWMHNLKSKKLPRLRTTKTDNQQDSIFSMQHTTLADAPTTMVSTRNFSASGTRMCVPRVIPTESATGPQDKQTDMEVDDTNEEEKKVTKNTPVRTTSIKKQRFVTADGKETVESTIILPTGPVAKARFAAARAKARGEQAETVVKFVETPTPDSVLSRLGPKQDVRDRLGPKVSGKMVTFGSAQKQAATSTSMDMDESGSSNSSDDDNDDERDSFHTFLERRQLLEKKIVVSTSSPAKPRQHVRIAAPSEVSTTTAGVLSSHATTSKVPIQKRLGAQMPSARRTGSTIITISPGQRRHVQKHARITPPASIRPSRGSLGTAAVRARGRLAASLRGRGGGLKRTLVFTPSRQGVMGRGRGGGTRGRGGVKRGGVFSRLG